MEKETNMKTIITKGVRGTGYPLSEDVQVWPTGNRLLIRPATVEEQKIGSIIVPNQAQRQRPWGEVLACGPEVEGAYLEKDIVIYTNYAGFPVPFGTDELILIPETDVQARFRSVVKGKS
jgi:co-chaperonin GroES (HSP10)